MTPAAVSLWSGASWECAVAEEPEQKLRFDLVAVNEAPAPRAGSRLPVTTRFNRHELQTILDVYGRKVVSGDWRDYAIDFLKDRALFSVYKRASERPLYVIEKNPKLRHKQGQYTVTIEDGRVLKRGHELENVLRVLELAVVR